MSTSDSISIYWDSQPALGSHLQRVTVSEEFRDMVLDTYPILTRHREYLLFMQYLLFGSRREWDTGRLIICAETLAACERKIKDCRDGNYRSIDFLRRFQSEVLPEFDWCPCVPKEKCRQVTNRGLNPEIRHALEHELFRSISEIEKRVYFDSGNQFSRAKQTDQRNEIERKVDETVTRREDKPNRRVIDHMNQLAPDGFTKTVRRNFDEALRAAQTITEPEKRNNALRTLRRIWDQPKPYYGPSREDASARVFPKNASMLTLKKEVRKKLTQDWVDYDLSSCQFAICAYLWEVPEVLDFLRSGGDIWADLHAYLGTDDLPSATRKEIKSGLKRPFYGLHYGLGESRIKAWVTREAGEYIDESSQFLDHWAMKLMLGARDEQLHKAIRDGGVTDYFETQHSVFGHEDARSALAIQAQSWELALLLPVIDLAKATDEFRITLWQHDGFTVSFHNRTKQDRWDRRIREVVNDQARKLEIPTELEVD